MVIVRVALFTLGGTIASTSAPGPARPAESFAAAGDGVTPRLTGADLPAAVPGLDAVPGFLDPPGRSLGRRVTGVLQLSRVTVS